MDVWRRELPAGEGQLIVLFISRDSSSSLDVSELTKAVADDAAARREQGWRLLSVASVGMRQMGTAGNILFQSGGQFATQAALIATYQLI